MSKDHLRREDHIAKEVRARVKQGMTIPVLMDELRAKYGENKFPATRPTFYKYYGNDVAEARGEFHAAIGQAIVDRALGPDPSDKLLEFLARAKAGWNPVQSVSMIEDGDSPDENTSAIHDLAALMGRSKQEDKSD